MTVTSSASASDALKQVTTAASAGAANETGVCFFLLVCCDSSGKSMKLIHLVCSFLVEI